MSAQTLEWISVSRSHSKLARFCSIPHLLITAKREHSLTVPIAAAIPGSRAHVNAKAREIDLRLLLLQSCITTTTRQLELLDKKTWVPSIHPLPSASRPSTDCDLAIVVVLLAEENKQAGLLIIEVRIGPWIAALPILVLQRPFSGRADMSCCL